MHKPTESKELFDSSSEENDISSTSEEAHRPSDAEEHETDDDLSIADTEDDTPQIIDVVEKNNADDSEALFSNLQEDITTSIMASATETKNKKLQKTTKKIISKKRKDFDETKTSKLPPTKVSKYAKNNEEEDLEEKAKQSVDLGSTPQLEYKHGMESLKKRQVTKNG